jgi:alpha-beta hydrolase superfamily lysophospholipase
MEKFILKNSIGNDIHVYFYDQAALPVKGIVHLIHGASEHIARYGLFAAYLNNHGYLAIGCDFLGHGLSTDTNAYVHYADKNGDSLALESLDLVQKFIKTRHPELPVYVLGHSMGSFLARLEIIQKPSFYKKAVISGTTTTPAFMTAMGTFLCNVIGAFKGPKYVSPMIQKMAIDANPAKMKKDGLIKDRDVEWLTRDVEIQNYYFNSPMCGQPFTVTANRDMFKWIKFIDADKNIAKGDKNLPILFISGGFDPLSNYGKNIGILVDRFQRLGYEDVAMHIYADDRHEVLNELDKQQVYADVLAFLDK